MSVEDLSSLTAEELRLKGNEAFKKKQYHKAIGFYSESLNKSLDHVVLSNRSQAFLKIKYYEAAMSDASESIKINPTPKAYFRRATSMHSLGFHSKAREDLKKVIELEPDNDEATDFLDTILIMLDRPIIPLKLLEKKPYVQSQKPMKSIPIEDIGTVEMKSGPSSSSLMDSGVSSTTDVSHTSQIEEDDPLPSPAETSMDLVVAFSSLKNRPDQVVEYFLTLDSSKFQTIFAAGVEAEFLETLIAGLQSTPKNEEILKRLVELAKCYDFDTAKMFCLDERKNDLNNYLSSFTTEFDELTEQLRETYIN
uniref:RNA-polymerase II-associated protein 3-like C-terminal domain-containing protein n=1 Tax=Panagrolaimus sp. JU765 TaxID=591449 RepID=A0AC34Q4Y0_9BILA